MRWLSLALLLVASTASADTGLEFPSNDDDTNTSNIYAFLFADTDDNGLPFYGTADGGVTVSWDIYPNDPGGSYAYWVTFFMDENDGTFPAAAFYGAHPYPWTYDGACPGNYGGGQTENPAWEVSSGINNTRDDIFDTASTCAAEDPENNLVTFDVWHYQAFTAVRSGSEVTLTFWTDLDGGSIPDPDKIVVVRTQNLGTFPIPTSLDMYWGAAPWQVINTANEKLNGIIRNIKIWDGLKTESYLNTNAGVDTQLTKAGDSDLWYHNPNPTPTDISDKSGGTAHNPEWVDQNFLPGLYAVPEPSTSLLMGFALATIGALRRAWRPVSGPPLASPLRQIVPRYIQTVQNHHVGPVRNRLARRR